MRSISVTPKTHEERMREILSGILTKMEANGFKTAKGTNTYTIANVVADFVTKIIDHRKHDLSALGIWGSNDLRVIVPMLFARYRIYNTRHTPAKYDVSHLNFGGSLKMGEPLNGYGKLVRVADGSNVVAEAKTETRLISNLKNEEPTDLGIPYDSLFEGSKLTSGDKVFNESYMSQTGVYVERDFVILPDEDGDAVFYPITDFSQETSESLTLTLLRKPKEELGCSFPKLSSGSEVTPDLLKFILTQAMARFAIFRGITTEELVIFIKEKFKTPVYWDKLLQLISVDLPPADIESIQKFAEENVTKEETIPKMVKPNTLVVTISGETNLLPEIRNFVSARVSGIFEKEEAVMLVYSLVDEFFASKFLLNANFEKSQNRVTIKVDVLGEPSGIGVETVKIMIN